MLGTMEAGLFPGVSYYLSCWYKRSEFGLRLAIFFSAATASGAFGGLLAGAGFLLSNASGFSCGIVIILFQLLFRTCMGLATNLVGHVSGGVA